MNGESIPQDRIFEILYTPLSAVDAVAVSKDGERFVRLRGCTQWLSLAEYYEGCIGSTDASYTVTSLKAWSRVCQRLSHLMDPNIQPRQYRVSACSREITEVRTSIITALSQSDARRQATDQEVQILAVERT
ncbi:MAG: hypothetical protein EA401_10680 [Planctomycetota bacterium]|nr:MAG: hypothetical protein EA401_10680 [Planctomycetota bacterium]